MAGVLLPLLVATAAGCGETFGARHPATEEGEKTATLWRGYLAVALVVALIVYGLMAFVLIRYRRRDDDAIPSQKGDRFSIELVYMTTPVLVVAALFAATLWTQNEIDDAGRRPSLTVEVTGFQWGWRFHYPDQDATVIGSSGDTKPVLVLPAHRTTRLVLRSTDVNHGFWVPSFLQKLDLIPGVDNQLRVTPTKAGTYDGRCAEYCGLDHWRMYFELRVVEPDDFDRALADAVKGSSS